MNQSMGFKTMVFLGVLALVGCDKKPVVPTAEEQTHNVFSLEIGQCFNDEQPVLGSEEDVSISTVPLIDCQQPHDNEVFANHSITDVSFPNDDRMDELGASLCQASFDAYVGKPYDDSVFSVGWISPTIESWRDNDRTINCILYQDDTKIVGSKRGAAI